MGQVFLRPGAWWGLRILTGTENVITCSSIRARITSVIWYLSGTTRIGSAFGPTIAAGYNLSGAADFNRDGKPDYLLFNPSTRQTAIWYLNNNVRIGTAVGPTLAAGYTLAAP